MGRAGLRSQLEDGRHAEDILTHSDTQRLINFDEPVAVLYISFLRQIPDTDDPGGLVRLMMSRLVPGSFVAISQLVSAARLRSWRSLNCSIRLKEVVAISAIRGMAMMVWPLLRTDRSTHHCRNAGMRPAAGSAERFLIPLSSSSVGVDG
jgi:hypothetical protein